MFKTLFFALFIVFSLNHYATAESPRLEKQQFEDINNRIQKSRVVVGENSSSNSNVLKMFDETISLWRQYYLQKNGDFDIQTLLAAVEFSAVKHKGQFRKDAAITPYIIHPIGVARSLWEEGKVRSVNVLVAALLHDTLEDTETTADEIEALFGPRVRYTIEELTNDPKLTSQENKQRQIDHAPFLSLNAQLVKLADRLYNIRDLRSLPPSIDREETINRYLQWGQKLLHALRGTNEALETALQNEISNQLANGKPEARSQ